MKKRHGKVGSELANRVYEYERAKQIQSFLIRRGRVCVVNQVKNIDAALPVWERHNVSIDKGVLVDFLA